MEMSRRTKHTEHHYDDVDESTIKSMTTEMTTAEPTTTIEDAATTTIADDKNPHVIVSQNLSTRPYSSLASVRPLPDTPVYSTLETQEIERAMDSPTIEVHYYVNVPMIETTPEDPIYMDLADSI